MNKMEYIYKLRERLSPLPEREREAAVKYYNELFDDAGPMNEQAVITSLGSPQNLAHTILNDKGKISYEFGKTKREVKTVRKKMTSQQSYIAIAVIVLTFPLWGTLLLAVFAVVAGIFLAAALSLTALGFSGVALICMGIAYISRAVSISLALSGAGISLISLSMLLFTPIMKLVIHLMKLIIKKCIRLLNKLIGRTEVRGG